MDILKDNLIKDPNIEKMFEKLKDGSESQFDKLKTTQELINEQITYVSTRDRIASILGVKPVNVVIRFINKIKSEPNDDPISALSVLMPYLKQDTELLQKVEHLVYQGLPKDQGLIQISYTKEIFDERHAVEGSPTFRRNRNIRKVQVC